MTPQRWRAGILTTPARLRTIAPILIIACVLPVGYAALKVAPDLFAETRGLDPAAQADARRGVRTNALVLFGGTLGLISLMYTRRTVELGRQGQITERFSRAIDHIGSDNTDVRLGGIYALQRIARESKPDHMPIMEILTAVARHRSPWSAETDAQQPPASQRCAPPSVPTTASDVQAIMSVLANRTARFDRRQHTLRLDQTYLRKIVAPGIDLSGFNLRGAQLEGADLTAARLHRADLTGAQLQDARLQGADMREARLTDAQLQGADLSGAFLQEAHLVNASLDSAVLVNTHLEGARLFRAQLVAARLTGARLRGALYTQSTRWPQGYPEGSGAKLVDAETSHD